MTVDADLLIVRVGERVLRIRRPVLLKALEHCQLIADALEETAASSRRLKSGVRHHPFVALDRSLDHPAHGALRPRVTELGDEFAGAIAHLKGLWPGELWALATLAKANPPTPTAPVRITSIN